MRARTGQRPVEDPEEEGKAKSKPAVQREFRFLAFDVFDLSIGCHTPSVH